MKSPVVNLYTACDPIYYLDRNEHNSTMCKHVDMLCVSDIFHEFVFLAMDPFAKEKAKRA